MTERSIVLVWQYISNLQYERQRSVKKPCKLLTDFRKKRMIPLQGDLIDMVY